MKILAVVFGILLTVLLLICGAFVTFFSMIALNGFTGKAGEWGMNAQMAWCVLMAIVFGLIAAFAGFYFSRAQENANTKYAITLLILLVVGGVAEFGGVIVAAIVAESLRIK